MRQRLGTLVTLGVVAAAASAMAAPATKSDGPACAAALEVIRAYGRDVTKPLVVADTPETQSAENYTPADLSTAPWRKSAPSLALSTAFLAAPPRSALRACPVLEKALNEAGIRTGDGVVSDITEVKPGKNGMVSTIYSADILSIALPVLSADGREALVQTGFVGGWLMGTGAIRLLRRNPAGRWEIVGFLHTWIA